MGDSERITQQPPKGVAVHHSYMYCIALCWPAGREQRTMSRRISERLMRWQQLIPGSIDYKIIHEAYYCFLYCTCSRTCRKAQRDRELWLRLSWRYHGSRAKGLELQLCFPTQ